MVQAAMRGFLCVALIIAPASGASLCSGVNAWNNPATGSTGACISNDKPNFQTYSWHCPWESDGLVSGFGCDAVKYDCADTTTINTLLSYYQNIAKPLEWGTQRMAYT